MPSYALVVHATNLCSLTHHHRPLRRQELPRPERLLRTLRGRAERPRGARATAGGLSEWQSDNECELAPWYTSNRIK